MPVVKTEQLDLHRPERPRPSPSARHGPIPSPLDYNGSRPRQYVLDRSARIHNPYFRSHSRGANLDIHRLQERIEPMEMRRREPIFTPDEYASTLTQAVAKASHEDLLSVGNSAYEHALRDLAQAQMEAAQCHQQNVRLSVVLASTRNAYDQLLEQYRVAIQRMQQPDAPQQQATIQTAPLPAQGTNTTETSTHLAQESNGPIIQPGGFKLRTRAGPWYETRETRPSDLPFEVFWQKSDWFGKGFPNGTFVRDRDGNYLGHLIKGIRDTTRKIWTELDNGSYQVGKSFYKNDLDFKMTYVATIEEIYPCLKLCDGHWKTLQIGIRTYPHWYASRNKKRREINHVKDESA